MGEDQICNVTEIRFIDKNNNETLIKSNGVNINQKIEIKHDVNKKLKLTTGFSVQLKNVDINEDLLKQAQVEDSYHTLQLNGCYYAGAINSKGRQKYKTCQHILKNTKSLRIKNKQKKIIDEIVSKTNKKYFTNKKYQVCVTYPKVKVSGVRADEFAIYGANGNYGVVTAVES